MVAPHLKQQCSSPCTKRAAARTPFHEPIDPDEQSLPHLICACAHELLFLCNACRCLWDRSHHLLAYKASLLLARVEEAIFMRVHRGVTFTVSRDEPPLSWQRVEIPSMTPASAASEPKFLSGPLQPPLSNPNIKKHTLFWCMCPLPPFLVNVLVWVLRGVYRFRQQHVCGRASGVDLYVLPRRPCLGKLLAWSVSGVSPPKYRNLNIAMRRDRCQSVAN